MRLSLFLQGLPYFCHIRYGSHDQPVAHLFSWGQLLQGAVWAMRRTRSGMTSADHTLAWKPTLFFSLIMRGFFGPASGKAILFDHLVAAFR
jgi:hypothetical protein